MSAPGLDVIGWFLATTHQMLGHDKTAALIGQPAGDKSQCLICRYEQGDPGVSKQAVINALQPTPEWANR